MTIRLRRGDHEIQLENMDAVRKALAGGQLLPTDEAWNPITKAWQPLTEVAGEVGGARQSTTPRGPHDVVVPAPAPSAPPAATSPAPTATARLVGWMRRRWLWLAIAAAAVVAAVVVSVVLVRRSAAKRLEEAEQAWSVATVAADEAERAWREIVRRGPPWGRSDVEQARAAAHARKEAADKAWHAVEVAPGDKADMWRVEADAATRKVAEIEAWATRTEQEIQERREVVEATPRPPEPALPPSPQQEFETDVGLDRDLGRWCQRIGPDLRDVCLALHRTSQAGQTDREARVAYESYLRDSGARRRSGYMIARHDDGVYEVKMSGDRNHALLATTVTDFTSQGAFNKWVRKTGTEQITTINGFVEEWNVYVEDAVGGIVDFVRRAPRGDETAETARDGIVLLIREAGVR